MAEGLNRFGTGAAILEAELSGRPWLVGDTVSYADFRMAAFLPVNDGARLPLHHYPSVGRWYRKLEAIDAWRDPFQGLDAPGFPSTRGAQAEVRNSRMAAGRSRRRTGAE